MKPLFLTFFVSVALIAAPSETPSVGGKWEIHSSIEGNESDMVCTFAQKESALTGSCVSDRGKFEISGKVTSDKIAWSYKSDYNGTALTVNYEGVMDSATKMRGNVDVPEFSAGGTFSATQSK